MSFRTTSVLLLNLFAYPLLFFGNCFGPQPAILFPPSASNNTCHLQLKNNLEIAENTFVFGHNPLMAETVSANMPAGRYRTVIIDGYKQATYHSVHINTNNVLDRLNCETLVFRNCNLHINDKDAFNVKLPRKRLVLENVIIFLGCDVHIPMDKISLIYPHATGLVVAGKDGALAQNKKPRYEIKTVVSIMR